MPKMSYKDYEIIDAHAHIFPQKIAEKATEAIGEFYDLAMDNEGSSEKLLAAGQTIGISRYLVCSTATVPTQTVRINDFIKEECDLHPEFFGFGTLHPDMEGLAEETERVIDLGLHGIKIHPDFQKFNIDDASAYKIYEIIEGRLPILVHMGDSRYDYSRPFRLARVLKDFPKLEVIAAHFGGYQRWEEAEGCLKHKNVKLDTCSSLFAITPAYARRLVSFYGAENLFFGTDFPMWNHMEELERFFAIGLKESDNRKILAENFKNYYKI